MDTLDDGARGHRRQSEAQTTRLSFAVRQKILKASPQLLRALTTMRHYRESAMQRWAEAEIDNDDRERAIQWARERREQILTSAIEELIEHREQAIRRNDAAELAVRRLNQIYEECMNASMTPVCDAV